MSKQNPAFDQEEEEEEEGEEFIQKLLQHILYVLCMYSGKFRKRIKSMKNI